MDLTAIFSDDQLAVMGCFAALAICGVIAAMSFQFGAAGQQTRNGENLRLTAGRTEQTGSQSRKAA